MFNSKDGSGHDMAIICIPSILMFDLLLLALDISFFKHVTKEVEWVEGVKTVLGPGS